MFIANFPQELVDHIVDQLYDDPASLRSCSRVCKAWLPASRFHLFAKVCLKAAPLQHGPVSFPAACCRRLLAAIERNPEIAACIRELEVCEGTSAAHLSASGIDSPEVYATAWATSEPALLALFMRLRHLRRLEFAAASMLYWTSLPPAFQSAFCALLATSSALTYLRLHSWCFPNFAPLALLLSHCKNLKGLSLLSTKVNTIPTDTFSPPYHRRLHSVIEAGEEDEDEEREPDNGCTMIRPANLEVLTLDFVTFGCLGALLFSAPAPVDISCLRELRVAHCRDISIIERLLLSVGPSLEHLHLKPGSWNVKPFDLSNNTSLRSLRLTLDEPDTALPWARAFLSPRYSSGRTTTTKPPLERIGLEFYIDVRKLDSCASIVSLLLLSSDDNNALSSLRHVEIGLFASPSSADFGKVDKAMEAVREGGRVQVRLYQLGVRSQRSNRELMPRISRYEN